MEVSRQYLGQHQLIQIISNVDPERLDLNEDSNGAISKLLTHLSA